MFLSEKKVRSLGRPPVQTARTAPPLGTSSISPCFEPLERRQMFSTAALPIAPPNWPDPTIAAGPLEVIESTNPHIIFYPKDGARVTWLTPNQLFPDGLFSSPFNLRLVYDDQGGRFILSAVEHTKSGVLPALSYLDLAVSKTDNPSNSPSDWYTYRFSGGMTQNGVFAPLDFDQLGFDNTAIYVTANMLPLGGNSTSFGARLFTFNKAELEGGTLSKGSVPAFITPSNDELWADDYSLQPAVTNGTSSVEYLVETDMTNNPCNDFIIYAISNPLGQMTVQRTTVNVTGFYLGVPNAPQKGSTHDIATLDASVLNVVNMDGNLWFCNSVKPLTQDVSAAAWYEVATNGWTGPSSAQTPSLVTEGQITPPGIYTAFPSVGVDASGNMVIGYLESSANMYPSAYYSTRTAAGVMSAPQVICKGVAAYDWNRWGDYTGTVADPFQAGVFYTAGEFVLNPLQWAVHYAMVTMPTGVPAPTFSVQLLGTPASALTLEGDESDPLADLLANS